MRKTETDLADVTEPNNIAVLNSNEETEGGDRLDETFDLAPHGKVGQSERALSTDNIALLRAQFNLRRNVMVETLCSLPPRRSDIPFHR